MSQIQATLFHYTTLLGFQGIVENRAIWASDIRYLNDFLEVKNAQDWIKYMLPDIEREYESSPHLDLAIAISERVRSDEITVFASCFCENGDRLSQWRGYTQNGVGVSIGFDPLILAEATKMPICKVAYGDHTISLLKATFDTFFREDGHNCSAAPDRSKLQLTRDLISLCVTSKAAAFHEEEEVRLVAHTHWVKTVQVKYRLRGNHMIPYLSIDLKNVWPDAIREIWLGPTNQSTSTWKSVREFLDYNGLGDVQLRKSDAPYRTS